MLNNVVITGDIYPRITYKLLYCKMHSPLPEIALQKKCPPVDHKYENLIIKLQHFYK